MVYEALEPFGEQRADLRAGIIASTIANVNRGKNQKVLSATDFMPYLIKDVEDSEQEARSRLMSLQQQFEGMKGVRK